MSVFQKLLNILKYQNNAEIDSSEFSKSKRAEASCCNKKYQHESRLKPFYKEYAISLLLNAYGNAKPIPEHYPQFYFRECGLTNPFTLHQQLINDGFLVLSSNSEQLSSLKLTELKQILQSCGLKVSGKKSELINRILENVEDEDLHNFFSYEKPCYSLSDKGKKFIKDHEDYIHFHRYAKYNISLEEYEHAKVLLKSNICEEILIYIFNQKKNLDKYNRFYHYLLSQLYDVIGDSSNALHEFLIVVYFDINYMTAFQWLNDSVQYLTSSNAAQHIFESQKNCNALTPNNVSYIVQHLNVYSHITVGSIYKEYPLNDLLVSEALFYSMISEMNEESFFDISKWNNYFVEQLKQHLF